MQTTANLGLKKPDGTDVVNIQDFNDNADLLDMAVAAKETPTGAQAKANAAEANAKAYADTKVAGLVNSSPAALDTLKELADALGSDPNYAATTATLIGTKANQTDFVAHQAVIASETVKGHVELATAAETTTGADNTRAVHPAGLKVELDKKANLASPALTGTPTVPTAPVSTNTTQAASTAFVKAVVAALVDSSPAALDTLNELAAALGDDPNFSATITNLLATKAPLASPAFTGTPTAPTADAGTNTAQVATTAYVQGESFTRRVGIEPVDLLAWATSQAATVGSWYFNITNTTTLGVPKVGWFNGILEASYTGVARLVLTNRSAPYETYTNILGSGVWSGWTRLLGNSDLSIGSTAPNNNLDDVAVPGISLVDSATLGTPGAGGSGSTCFTSVYSSTTMTQFYLGRIADVAYYRRKSSGVWQPWVEILLSSDLGSANGVASLDGNGLLATSQRTTLPIMFGGGSDGTVTISADTVLTRDMYYNNLTINSGKTLYCRGWKIFVKGTLTNNGTIINNGDDASGTTGGMGGFVNGSQSSNSQGKGGGGRSDGNGGGNGTTGSWGGTGGTGGTSGGSGTSAGTGGTASPPTALSTAFDFLKDIFYSTYNGGGGGGGGGAGGSFVASGGGGGGGGVIHIYADKIVNNGVIRAEGGKGALGAYDAQNHWAASGGGGGGGMILLVYRAFPTRGTVSVAGGAGGGVVDGRANTAGSAGSAGVLKEVPLV